MQLNFHIGSYLIKKYFCMDLSGANMNGKFILDISVKSGETFGKVINTLFLWNIGGRQLYNSGSKISQKLFSVQIYIIILVTSRIKIIC